MSKNGEEMLEEEWQYGKEMVEEEWQYGRGLMMGREEPKIEGKS